MSFINLLEPSSRNPFAQNIDSARDRGANEELFSVVFYACLDQGPWAIPDAGLKMEDFYREGRKIACAVPGVGGCCRSDPFGSSAATLVAALANCLDRGIARTLCEGVADFRV